MPKRQRVAAEARFRLRTAKVFLTYPKWSDDKPDLAEVKRHVVAVLGQRGVPEDTLGGVVAGEKHQDGSWHIHVVLHFTTECEVNDARAFDIGDRHPNIQAVRSFRLVRGYVTKDDYFIAWGTGEAPESRADILKLMVEQKLQPWEAVQRFPSLLCGYTRLVNDYNALIGDVMARSEADRIIIVYWLYGPAGTGKSRWARENYPDAYRLPRTGRWFNGYHGQPALIMDDYRAGFAYHELLSILDRYPIQLETKGGMIRARWTTVIITADKHPKDLYPKSWDEQLNRRITRIVDFGCPIDKGLFMQGELLGAGPDYIDEQDTIDGWHVQQP